MPPIDQEFVDHCRVLVETFVKSNRKELPKKIIVWDEEIPTSGDLEPIIEKYTNQFVRDYIHFTFAMAGKSKEMLDPEKLSTIAHIVLYNQQEDPELEEGYLLKSKELALTAQLFYDELKTSWSIARSLADPVRYRSAPPAVEKEATDRDETEDFFD